MMASTPDELIVGFPHSSLPKVTVKNTFEELKIIQHLLNTNAIGVSSYKGGGLHGHLGTIMTNEEYFEVATYVFPAPANPEATTHVEATRVYHKYHNVDEAFKKLVIDAFEDPFLNALSDEVVSYTNWTSLQLITHLLTYYAMIAPTELTQNYERLNTPYDPDQQSRPCCSRSKMVEPLQSPEDSLTSLHRYYDC
jgi:hypothetical protein